jgi:hypothetical protein
MRKNISLLSILVFLLAACAPASQAIIPTSTQAEPTPDANQPSTTPAPPTADPSQPTLDPTRLFYVYSEGLVVHGVLVPIEPRLSDFTAVLGEPSRSITPEYFTYHIYDQIGLILETPPNSDSVMVAILCIHCDTDVPFRPSQSFTDVLVSDMYGVPYDKSFSEVLNTLPNVKEDAQYAGRTYSTIFGDKDLKLLFFLDQKADKIIWINIYFKDSF